MNVVLTNVCTTGGGPTASNFLEDFDGWRNGVPGLPGRLSAGTKVALGGGIPGGSLDLGPSERSMGKFRACGGGVSKDVSAAFVVRRPVFRGNHSDTPEIRITLGPGHP